MANTLLQKTSTAFGNSASARTLQYVSNVTAGSLLLLWVTYEDGSGSTLNTVTISDNVNGAWTQAGGYVTANSNTAGRRGAWFYFANSAGGSKPIITMTPGASVYSSLHILEYSVPSPTGVTVDGTSSGSPLTGGTTTVSTGTCPVSGAGELVVAGWGQGNASGEVVTVSSPFTVETSEHDGPTEGGGTADDTNASGAEGATFTTTVAFAFPVAMAVSFITGTVATGPKYPQLERGIRGLNRGLHAGVA